MKKLGHFLFPFLSLITIVYGCGMSLHNEVTTRAMYTFNFNTKYNKYAKYLHNYPEFVQAGSFFPDWGFNCMENNKVSEAAHWPPFMRAGVEFVHEKYNKATWEYDSVAQGIISFLFAVVSHGAADVTWHSIEFNSGFIRAMADLNFINNFPEAHTAADNGGEFTLSHMTSLDYLVDKWSFPIDDLVEIYRRINQTVDGKQIAGCAKRAFAAAHANKLFGKHFFALYGEKSPFLIEQIELYHKGGINNMAADVTDCWHEFANWLETGTFSDVELCNTFHGKYLENKYQPPSNDLINFLYNHSVDILETTGYIIRYHKKNGIGTFEIHRQSLSDQDFSASDEVENLKVEEYGFDQIFQDIPTKEEQISSLNEDIVFNEDQDIASINLPWANSDHLPSSYSYDILNISLGIKCYLVSDDSHKVLTMDIPYSYARFGHDMVVGDFNGDGIQDLAISAPFYQAGAIFIINGKKSGSFKTPKSTNIFDIADKIIYAYNDDDDPQLRFGWSMSVVDLNKDGIDDLAVSAPSSGAKNYTYNGKVYVYFGRKNKGLRENKADLEIIPKQDVLESEWQIEGLGQYMSSGDVDGDGFDDLLIGCPYCGLYNNLRSPRLLHTGGVFAFLSSSDHRGNVTIYDYDWSIKSPGDHQYEWFGYSIDYYKSESMQHPIIIVGAPGYVMRTQGSESGGDKIQMSGRIYGFEMKDKVENGQVRKIPVKIFDLSGVEEFQGFGSSLIAGDFLENGEDFILVASNSEAYNKRFPRYGKNWQAGAIRLINMRHLKNNENKTLSDDDMVLGEGLVALLRGSESASRFGSSLLWDNDEKSFWFSEPFTYWESGRIFKYSIESLSGSSRLESVFSEGCFVGRERQARFGSKIIKFDFDGDGKKDLVVSSEHSGYAARLSGSVTVILD